MENYIGLNISYLCKLHKLKQSEFGDLFGIKQTTVNTYTGGRSNPPVDVIQKICKHFSITIDDFINAKLEEKNTDSHRELPLVKEPTPVYSTDSRMIIDAQAETITSLKDQIAILKEMVETLKEKPARAS